MLACNGNLLGFTFTLFTFIIFRLINRGTCVAVTSSPPSRPQNAPSLTTIVRNNIQIVDISQVNIENMDFRVDFYIRQVWTDAGIDSENDFFNFENEPHITGNGLLNYIWAPDFFISNGRVGAVKSLSVTSSTANLFRNKTVEYTARLWAVLGCQMTFEWYPMDVQGCQLIIESFSYTTEKVLFVWDENSPIVMPDDIKLLRYSLLLPLQIRNSSAYRFGIQEDQYSSIQVLFIFKRLIGNHLIKTYTPTFLVVCLSWFSFWLGMDAIPGRISLLVTAMLTLVTMFSGFNKDVPPVTYIKMMDIWMVGCMVFVFAAIFEFVIVKNMYDVVQRNEPHSETEIVKGPFQPFKPENDFILTKAGMMSHLLSNQAWALHFGAINDTHRIASSGSSTGSSNQLLRYQGFARNWGKVDKISRILFPILFTIFTAVYVPILVFCSMQEIDVLISTLSLCSEALGMIVSLGAPIVNKLRLYWKPILLQISSLFIQPKSFYTYNPDQTIC